MTGNKISVLVAEDSAVTRQLLVRLIESDPAMRVVGSVADGQAALDFVARHKPDVVLMDIYMPGLDGFEATRRIMETHPVPIVVCSAAADTKDLVIAFRAMEAGAVACIEKPRGTDGSAAISASLVETVKLMSEVKVVRRTGRSRPAAAPPEQGRFGEPAAGQRVRLIGIGASTGGPPVLQSILAGLPKDFPVPMLVVQHIARGFLAGMAEWLNNTTALHVQIASHRLQPLPGHVYLAPDDFHMGIAAGGEIVLTREGPENHVRPAVSFLFRSLAQVHGPEALGVLLTGMGSDGAEELRAMRDRGAVTIAQDRDSSVVHGMPGVAIALGAATHVLPADRIAEALVELVNDRSDKRSRQ